MQIYRFSPIETNDQIEEALEYIVLELQKLSRELLQQDLPINTLKLFAHYPAEYDFLLNYVESSGKKASFSSDTSYYAEVSRTIKGEKIEYIGVRIVDPYRPHVGCGDYEIANFAELKTEFAGKSAYIRDFREDMIELWHPDFDVLGYIVPPL